MSYRIEVTRTEPNPDYAKQLADYTDRSRDRGPGYAIYAQPEHPSAEREIKALVAVLTDAEWEIVKRAVLQHWASQPESTP